MKHDAKSDLEKAFAAQVLQFQLPEPEREFFFAQEAFGRKWRLDFFWPRYALGVELHGLIVVSGPSGEGIVRGGHGTVGGMRRDMEKRNAAVLLQIDVLTFEQTMVANGSAIAMTQRALTVKGWRRGS